MRLIALTVVAQGFERKQKSVGVARGADKWRRNIKRYAPIAMVITRGIKGKKLVERVAERGKEHVVVVTVAVKRDVKSVAVEERLDVHNAMETVL